MGYDQGRYLSFSRILLSGDSEVVYWTRELGVDELSLRIAIATVGRDEPQVRDFLPQLIPGNVKSSGLA